MGLMFFQILRDVADRSAQHGVSDQSRYSEGTAAVEWGVEENLQKCVE